MLRCNQLLEEARKRGGNPLIRDPNPRLQIICPARKANSFGALTSLGCRAQIIGRSLSTSRLGGLAILIGVEPAPLVQVLRRVVGAPKSGDQSAVW